MIDELKYQYILDMSAWDIYNALKHSDDPQMQLFARLAYLVDNISEKLDIEIARNHPIDY